jgi:Asp-tRNA(Asn)/Glu-tRNA(Gln) amidotransferase A subunit family amidase
VQNPSANKVKVGFLLETPFIKVSEATKRALNMAREALVKSGYEVVDFDITPQEFDEAKKFLVSFIAQGIGGLSEDIDNEGEKVNLGTWANMFYHGASSFTKGFF